MKIYAFETECVYGRARRLRPARVHLPSGWTMEDTRRIRALAAKGMRIADIADAEGISEAIARHLLGHGGEFR